MISENLLCGDVTSEHTVSDGSELHRLLSNRGPVLEAIRNGNQQRGEIMEEVGVARSTAYKVRDLEETGLVEYGGGECKLTPHGDCARHLHIKVTSLSKKGDIFNLLPDDIDYELLLDTCIPTETARSTGTYGENGKCCSRG